MYDFDIVWKEYVYFVYIYLNNEQFVNDLNFFYLDYDQLLLMFENIFLDV